MVVEESVSVAVIIKSEVSQVKKTKAEERSEGVVKSEVPEESSRMSARRSISTQ